MTALETAYVNPIKINQENLDLLIDSITSGSKPYFSIALKKLAITCPENCATICEYISAEITEMNIMQSTKEGKIKVLIWLSTFLQHMPFHKMVKQNLLSYLDSLRRPQSQDLNQKWIGSYNSRQMILNKFFRWLYNPDEPDPKRRVMPVCMKGVKKLPRQEKSPYKPSDLWNSREHSIFLKYCPNKRDRCYHAMANDMSARLHEILNLCSLKLDLDLLADAQEWVERIANTANVICDDSDDNRIKLNEQHTGIIIESNNARALGCIGCAIESRLDTIPSKLKPTFQKIVGLY
jgi:hypothetical protein